MELKVWVEGIQRVVCGVTESTTCQVSKLKFYGTVIIFGIFFFVCHRMWYMH